jgi:hypothetical protein
MEKSGQNRPESYSEPKPRQGFDWLVRISLCGVLVVLIFTLGGIFEPYRTDGGYNLSRTKMDIASIRAAAQQFETVYGRLPIGTNALLFHALFGGNPQKTVFLEGRTNNTGELLDPWGTPYRIEIGETNFLISSAGKDGKWGDKDDYIFDGKSGIYIQDPVSGKP